MLIGRFLMIMPIMALAGSLAQKKIVAAERRDTFPVSGPTFIVLLVGTVLLVGALNFPARARARPVVEHFLMHGRQAVLIADVDSTERHLSIASS